MLVIRRRPGESILIGDDIEIQVAEIGAGRVKLGIAAPAQVTVVRKEVKLTRDQNLAAAKGISLRPLAELAAQVARAR
jgi:carbon storage regulator